MSALDDDARSAGGYHKPTRGRTKQCACRTLRLNEFEHCYQQQRQQQLHIEFEEHERLRFI